MLRYFYCLLIVSIGQLACQEPVVKPDAPVLPPVKSYTGLIRFDKGFCSFADCSNGALYLIADSTRTIFKLHQTACQPAECPDETVWGTVKARLFKGADPRSDPGTLAITEIDSMAPKNMFNCCIPFDYWCSGTEPFWGLQISKSEKALFFKNIGAETGTTYNWAPPEVVGGKTIYSVKNRNNPAETMVVTITHTPCSDGMSDTKYHHAVTLKVGGETFQGCGVKWGEQKEMERY